MNKKELKIILEKHGKWLKGEDDGLRADLSYADLRYANLSNTDLRHVNLRYADLSNANLSNADLGYADLMGVNLRHTNLSNADLRHANLDFIQLNLSCYGPSFKIDEKIAKQITYHLINLMQYSNLDCDNIFKKNVYKWVNDSDVIKKYELKELKEKRNETK